MQALLPSRFRPLVVLSLLGIAYTWLLPAAVAGQVWSGYSFTFSKAAGTADTLPQNQDAIFSDVKLTRGSSGGLINIAMESFYSGGSSPAGTQWATGLMPSNTGQAINAANWQQLGFTDWIDAFGGAHTGGSGIAGTPAVLHLLNENVYLDIEFTSWSSGDGGAFSYTRAVAPVPEPSSVLLAGVGLALWCGLARAKRS